MKGCVAMGSLWSRTAQPPTFPALDRDLTTDVLIIGGGLAGVLCCHCLTRAGVDCALVEARTLCSGVTKDTTAKLTSQHGLIYQRLVKEFDRETARLYYEANQAALEEYRALCRGIDCDFEEKDSFLYAMEDRRALDREMEALEELSIPAKLVEKLPLPFPTVGAVCFPRQAQFHPLKFISAVSKGLPIYERTAAREFLPGGVSTGEHIIHAARVIVCTHFPFLNKHGSYFLKLYQERSYVLALEDGPQVEGMYLDGVGDGPSLRNYGGYLLLGGGGHRTGRPGEGWNGLSSLANRYYPSKKEACRWAAQDCITLDGVPYIGRYSPRTPGLFVATGFNKWGMTSSMVSALVLTDLLTGRENPWAHVFDPSRTILRPQLAVNAMEAAADLMTFGERRCPHMGCALKWNPQERSWDCPCHGSRFSEEGKLLDNPATGDLS